MRKQGRFSFLVYATLWIGIAGAATMSGKSYWTIPFQDRPYAPMHESWKPAGTIGHGFGILGSLMITIGVITYSTRKRLRKLAKWGRLSSWLRFHIFLCTLGPFLVLLHTAFVIRGIVAIAFWSMAVVTVSGIFGRYLYAHIPRPDFTPRTEGPPERAAYRIARYKQLFGYWHMLHLPLAVVMFIIMFVHVAVAFFFGYTWVF